MHARQLITLAVMIGTVGAMGAQTTTTKTPAARAAAARRKAAAAKAAAANAAPDDTKAVGDIPPIEGAAKPLFALRYIDIKAGAGPLAETHKFYTVQYTGWTPDGKKFDSSYDRDSPFVFAQGARRVIIGWDEGFEGMHVGGKRRLFVPYELGYGEAGHPPTIPSKSMLIFDVELLGVSDTPPPPPTPATPPPAKPDSSQEAKPQ